MEEAENRHSPELDQANGIGRLIEAARAGSREALGELLERYERHLLLIADRELTPLLRAKESPSDIVQEAFLDMQAVFSQFKGQTEQELFAWLRQTLLHRVAKAHRRWLGTAKRDMAREEIQIAPGEDSRWQRHAVRQVDLPSAIAMAHEQQERLDRILEGLSSDYREVILLHHRDGLPFKEIAERMARSETAVRKLWVRAVRQLQERLEETGGPQ